MNSEIRRFRVGRLGFLLLTVIGIVEPTSLPGHLSAQEPDPDTGIPLAGRVVREGEPVAGSRVTLHRVTPQASGEVASVVADESGAFRFYLEPAAGTDFVVYFATADYLSVRYFGRPIHPSEAGEEYLVAVYDTTYSLPEPLRIARRDLILLPEFNGMAEVNDLIQIHNPSRRALVGASGMPSWEFRIPAEATDFEVGEQADILPHEVVRMGDRVMILTPVIPGNRTLLIRYRLPRGPATYDLPISAPTDTFNLVARVPSHLASVAGLQAGQPFDLDGEIFLPHVALGVPAGTAISFRWDRPPGSLLDPVIAAVGVTLLLLGLGLFAAVRNHRAPS
jgi:hypothetical protein